MTSRRTFLAGLSASAAAVALPGMAFAQNGPKKLAMPPLLDATGTGRIELTAMAGRTNFLGLSDTETWGYNQPYLGPTLRLNAKGETAATVQNALRRHISVHWHGLIAPGDVDGGPHQPVAPGATWQPVLPVDQPPATIWYHSHIHGETAPQVHRGLAGILQLTDGRDDERGLPSSYGEDDLTLVLQDKRFDRSGRMVYDPSMQDTMMGFSGDMMLVNGQFGAVASVPKGIVRLRLVNASNARIYTLSFEDGRPMHLVGTDSGLLDKPIPLQVLPLAPAERAEVLVDFSSGGAARLVSGPNINSEGMMGGGMMGGGRGMMGGGRGITPAEGSAFVVLPFEVDETRKARIDTLPANVGGSLAQVKGEVVGTRHLALEMNMGPMMMFSRRGRRFSISGDSMDMRVINQQIKLGTVERWIISAEMLMHPFHVHGVAFQVVGENGAAPRPENLGWKDTVLVNGQAEILIRFTQPASRKIPYMYHCHILEHEDGGMMGQFAVA